MTLAALQPRRLGAVAGLPVLTAVLSIVCGAMVVARPLVAAIAPLLFVWAFVIADWRRGLRILVIVLPFATMAAFLTSSPYAHLLKDVVLIVPLYIGFVAWMVRHHVPLAPPRDVLTMVMGVFALLVVGYTVASPSLLAGLIGAKTWLAYLPLYFVGYHSVRQWSDVEWMVRAIALIAIVPAALGLAEFVLFVHSGSFGPFLALYGPLKSQIVQEVAFVNQIPRITATFTSAASFYNFALLGFACAIAVTPSRSSRIWTSLAFVLGVATVLSGLRRAYITVPLLVLAWLLIGRARPKLHIGAFVALGGGVLALLSFGIDISAFATAVQDHTTNTVSWVARREFVPSFSLFGHGTGTGTNAAIRYANLMPDGQWKEGWYTKAQVEFGFPGFAISALLLGCVVRRALWTARVLPPPQRMVIAALASFVVVTATTLVKAAELDWDPLNAYFWLVAGVIVAAGHLPHAGHGDEGLGR